MTCLSRSLSPANSGMESPILTALGNGWNLVQFFPALLFSTQSIHQWANAYWAFIPAEVPTTPTSRAGLWEHGKQKANIYFSLWKGAIWLALKLTDGLRPWCANLPSLCPTPWKFITGRVLFLFCVKRGSLHCSQAILKKYIAPLLNGKFIEDKTGYYSCLLNIMHCPSRCCAYIFLFFLDPE